MYTSYRVSQKKKTMKNKSKNKTFKKDKILLTQRLWQ